MMFSYMFSSDIFVEDMRAQADLLVRHLGIRAPGPRAIVTDSPEAHATMLRLQRKFDEAPTRLEVIQPAQVSGHWNVAHIQEAWADQKDRPVRFHNTIFTADIEILADSLRQRGIPVTVDTTLEFGRLWVGIDPENITKYNPTFDAGLRVEVLPFSYFPVEDIGDDLTIASGSESPRRVVSRSFLVEDLDAVVTRLDKTFGWEPEGPVHSLDSDGVRRAVFGFPNTRSARLELLQPTDGGAPAAQFLARHGEGPYTLSFSVTDFNGWMQRLQESGVNATASEHEIHGRRLVVEPGPLGAVRVELLCDMP